jgi:hypothetical protein
MPITHLQDAAEVTPLVNCLFPPPLRAKPALTGCTALIARATMRQMTNVAPSGIISSIMIGSMQNMKRYALADAKVLIGLTSDPFMSSTNYENRAENGLKDTISFLSFNVNKNYLYTETLLVHLSLQKKVDVIFLQEPPWRTIRHTPSTSQLECNIPQTGSDW